MNTSDYHLTTHLRPFSSTPVKPFIAAAVVTAEVEEAEEEEVQDTTTAMIPLLGPSKVTVRRDLSETAGVPECGFVRSVRMETVLGSAGSIL
jgi:hypothetical protein